VVINSALPAPRRCHAGQPSLQITVDCHIDVFSGWQKDAITRRRGGSGWSREAKGPRLDMNRRLDGS